MTERKHPLAECERCPLNEFGKFVPSSGPEKANLAFVGESPSVKDTRSQENFSGQSGKLLDVVLEHHGIARDQVFLTNAVLCRPPGNAPVPSSAISACRPRLLAELQGHGSTHVVALGNSASEAVLGKSGITKLRVGPGRETANLPGAIVHPTFAPAACLRQGDSFPYLVTDVGKAVTDGKPWVEPRWRAYDTPAECLQVLAQLQGLEGPVVIDIEVDIEKDFAFGHPNQYGLLCVGIAFAEGRAVVLGESGLRDRRVLDKLSEYLRGRRIIAQNGKFDLAGLYPHLGPLELWFDTMIAHYVMDERPGIHGLKQMAIEYLGAPAYEEEIKKYVGAKEGYGVIPRDILYRYNAYDVTCTYALYELFSKRLDAPGKWPYTNIPVKRLRDVHDFLVAASNQLMYVELNGIAVDRTYLKELTTDYLGRLHNIETDLDLILSKATAGKIVSINPRSPLQLKKALAAMQIEVDSTNKDTLELVLSKCDPESKRYEFVETLLKHRREAKLYGTYVKGIDQRLYGGRVFPTFLLHGTTTGRLACRNPNVQNIPRESSIRRLFVPAKDGNVFVQTDYSQAELRVLSFLARDTYFRDIFNGGERDLFDELTPVLYPHANKETMSKAEWKELRIRVKAYVYGLSYGRTEFSIAREYKLSIKEAREGMAAFFKVIPEIVDFQKKVKSLILSGQDLINPFGRHRRYYLITNENVDNVMNEALAFLPQSTASDMCVQALIRVRKEFSGTGCYIRNIIHDALLAEGPAEKADWMVETMNRAMVESAQSIVGDYVKFATDSKIGHNWGEV